MPITAQALQQTRFTPAQQYQQQPQYQYQQQQHQ
jgi:hypothetical protein